MTTRTKIILAGSIAGFFLCIAGYVDSTLILLTIGVFVSCIVIGDK